MKRKGEIAVFLVLLLSVLSAFVVALTANVRKQLIMSEAMSAGDAAIRSCFAEYNRACYEKYHIYLLDSSYKGDSGGLNKLRNHFDEYMSANMSDVILCETEVIEEENAYESNSEYLYKRALEYAERVNIPDARDGISDEQSRFISYLVSVCGNCNNCSEDSIRAGEIEYLLYGFNNDSININLALADYEEEMKADDGTNKGYEDYLTERLFEEGILTLRRRFAQLLTEYLRMNGSPGFSLEDSFGYLKICARVKGNNNKEYTVTREYSYER